MTTKLQQEQYEKRRGNVAKRRISSGSRMNVQIPYTRLAEWIIVFVREYIHMESVESNF